MSLLHKPPEFAEQEQWYQTGSLKPQVFVCGYCENQVGAHIGFYTTNHAAGRQNFIYICPNCKCPTFFDSEGNRYPGGVTAGKVEGVPSDINDLYTQARSSAIGAPTLAVMGCRTILMHIAVAKGAEEGKNFTYYVDYLVNQRYVPPGSEEWLSVIRTRGNAANHEILLMTEKDSETLVGFVYWLLKFIYEMPFMARTLQK